jgi:hypothetical protein
MRGIIWIALLLVLWGCDNNELTWLSVKNDTTIRIYVSPYSSDFTNANWIQPGVSGDFYSINCDCLDGFTYFSHYYDSLIVLMEDHEADPIKFYKDGTTVNYDPELNPFINPEVWKVKDFNRAVSGSAFNTMEEKRIFEHYFCIREEHVKSLSIERVSDPGL